MPLQQAVPVICSRECPPVLELPTYVSLWETLAGFAFGLRERLGLVAQLVRARA